MMKLAINLEERLSLFFGQLGDGSLSLLVLLQVFAAAQTAAERERALSGVIAWTRMENAKRTVFALAVSDPVPPLNSLVVAAVTEPLCTTAVEERN